VNHTCTSGETLLTLGGNYDKNWQCYEFDESKVPPIILLYGVPGFLISLTLEWIFADLILKKGLFRFNDTINSLSHGIFSQLVGALVKSLGVVPYAYVFKHYAIYRFPLDTPFLWLLVLLGVDFIYYCYHRLAHEMNAWWGTHSTHHSSEEYNLSTALRQSGIYISWALYLPLALFFPAELYLIHMQINLVYQFWIHTEVVKSIGPLEWILNTPSHHRVHHGRNPKYLDKNYAGIFIIWDRMFGTFQQEEEAPVYGLVHPLTTWSPFWSQFHNPIELVQQIISTPGIMNKIKLLYKPPGWNPIKDVVLQAPDVPTREQVVKFDTTVSSILKIYIFIHFGIVTAAGVASMLFIKKIGDLVFAGYTAYFLISLEITGLLLGDDRRLAWYIELARLVTGWILTRDALISFGIDQYLWGLHILCIISVLFCVSQVIQLPSKQKTQ